MTTIAAGLDDAIVWTIVGALFLGVYAAISLSHVWVEKLLPPSYPLARRRASVDRFNRRFGAVAARGAAGALAVLVVELVLRLIATIAGG